MNDNSKKEKMEKMFFFFTFRMYTRIDLSCIMLYDLYISLRSKLFALFFFQFSTRRRTVLMVQTVLKVALQILGRKFYNNT